MRLDGRRESSNVQDNRRMKIAGRAGGLGIGGLIIVGLITWLLGGNPLSVIQEGIGGSLGLEQTYEPSPEEDALATFSSQILAGTEDVWTKVFAENGRRYQPPRLVLFSGATDSGCGYASAATGPFYCSADQTIYLDVSFFKEMERRFGAKGEFAFAYVIAHEVGHHVQYLLGTLDKAHAAMSKASKKDANAISVRLELQADYYAGLWAHHDNKMFRSMEIGDLEDGLVAAQAIGDDRLQMQVQGYTVPESFNHGTSKQRMAWLRKGYARGTLEDGDTFNLPDPY
ncbi:MAG: neutral zinc metallopeptidase [Porphyromonas sp.]|nr:neutral zinc metallopeptidase [Porphyromonas sp.]